MGTGKSRFGLMLAGRLKMRFVDCDAYLEKQEGRSILKIFEEDGEAYFRKLESVVLKKVVKNKKVVLATGGGVVLLAQNRHWIKRNGFVVWLKSSPKKIFERLKRGDDRPLLKVDDKMKEIVRLLNVREPLYKALADFTLSNRGRTIAPAVFRLMRVLKKKGVVA